ncbi:uncharacterized protein LOC113324098 [Papaver somniferum]|uniref:uncharacterized protein LOC113324098 n=1 Tax=Papaver somniferum TaxID=3469 RepID=UPI000E6F90A6|nr:uncharacterized protein LOC113324098 [Papaver somniferum]
MEKHLQDLTSQMSSMDESSNQLVRVLEARESASPPVNTRSRKQTDGMGKLLLPHFDGTDPEGLIYKVELYFEFYETPPLQQVGFSTALLKRFGRNHYDDPAASLAKLSQMSSLAEYQEEFERLSNMVTGLSEDFLISCYIGGLKEELRLEVQSFNPLTLVNAIGIARLQNDKLAILSKGYRNYQKTPVVAAQPLAIKAAPQATNSPPIKRLTPEKLMQGEDGNIGEAEQELSDDEDGEETAEISLHALAGSFTPQTMRVQGEIKRLPITILIDTGSTHNFTEPSISKRVNLKFVKDTQFEVMVANGTKIPCVGLCPNLEFRLQKHMFSGDFHLLKLGGCDMVLGAQWLQTLGPITWDFNKLVMEFVSQGSKIRLVDNQTLKTKVASAHTMQRLIAKGGQWVLCQVCLNPTTDKTISIPKDIQDVIDGFKEVVTWIMQLPPVREHDHKINLIPGSTPINVRSYRYTHFQKAEIEKVVKELLDSGLIRPSTSPFSSPVLLVKKKDGSWIMCVDYRALNKVTIKDKFLIPVIEELLDELHGSKYFTKLDLRSGYHQILIHKPDIGKTAFGTHDGHYEFLVMPFGLTNAPSTFQHLMNDIFRPYLRRFILMFFDDILIYSRNWADHLNHLKTIFKLFKDN